MAGVEFFYSHPTELMAGRRIFATALVVLITLTAQIAAQYFLAERAVQAVRRTTLGGLFPLSPNPPGRAMRRRFDPLSRRFSFVVLCVCGTIEQRAPTGT